MPDFIGSASSDPVSLAVRKLTKNCVHLCLAGSIHASLFDPPPLSSTHPHEANPVWQRLKRLEVKSCMFGPDGKWLIKPEPDNLIPNTPGPPPGDLDFFHPPPGYGNTESELSTARRYYTQWRSILLGDAVDSRMEVTVRDPDIPATVNDVSMNALLTAFARGCKRMPALHTAMFVSEYFNSWPFQIHCIAEGTDAPNNWDARLVYGTRGEWRVFFHVHDWRPDEETLKEFRLIGRERNGYDSILHFLPWGDFAK